MLFKTHGPLCQALVQELCAKIIPPCITSPIKQKKKFALFLLDDMVEFLGDALAPQFSDVSTALVAFATNQSPALRQAASYGLGMMAKNSGGLFGGVAPQVLQALKTAIEFENPSVAAGGKSKEKQWKHARDNAISALGKVLKHQPGSVDAATIVPAWL